MPKILFHICEGVYPSVVGGMEIFNYYLIKNLTPEVAVFSSLKFDFDTEYIRYRKIRPAKIFDGIQLFLVLLRRRDIETVVFSYSEAHWLLWHMNMLAVRLAGREYISIIHHGKAPSSENERRYREFLRYSAKVISVSDDIKRNYDRVFGTDCIVIPPLIPFELSSYSKNECREKFGMEPGYSLICQVGTVKEMKNPQTLIEALSLFSAPEMEKYNPHVVFAGRNLMQEKLEELIRRVGMEARIHFLDFVPVETVRDVMRMSDIYVISSDYEGTSVSLLEAMFNSMPILASDVRGIRDMVSNEENALMFPVKDACALKDGIIDFLESEKLRKTLGNKARETYLARFEYSSVVDSYKEMLGIKV